MIRRPCLAIPLALGLLAGCGGEAVRYLPVSGTVTLNSKPFGDAQIRFTPDPGNKWITAGYDTTGPAGNYKAMSGGRSGLSPGKYKVVITEKPPEAATPGSDGDDPEMQAIMTKAKLEGMGVAAAKKKVEPIKGTFDAEIKPDQGIYDFDVKAAVP